MTEVIHLSRRLVQSLPHKYMANLEYTHRKKKKVQGISFEARKRLDDC